MRKKLLFAGELFCFLIFMILMNCTVFAGTTYVSTAAELVNAAKTASTATINVTTPISLDQTVVLNGVNGNVTVTGETITRAPGFTGSLFDLGKSTGTAGGYSYTEYMNITFATLTLKDIVVDGNKTSVPTADPVITSTNGGTVYFENAVVKNNGGAVLHATNNSSGYSTVDFYMEGGAITGNNGTYYSWYTGSYYTGSVNVIDTGNRKTEQGGTYIKRATITDNGGSFRFSKDLTVEDSVFRNNDCFSMMHNNTFSNCSISDTKLVVSESNTALTLSNCSLSTSSDYVIYASKSYASITLKDTILNGSIYESYGGDVHLSGRTSVAAGHKIEFDSMFDVNHVYVDGKLTVPDMIAIVSVDSFKTAAEDQFKLIYIPDSSYASIDQFSTGVSGYRFVLGSDHWATVVKDTNPANNTDPANSSVNAGSGKKQGQVITGGITSKKIKYKAVSKKNQKFQIGAAAKTAVTYRLAGYADKKTRKAKKYFRVASDGTVTVKKGCKKGIYKLKVEMKAAGNASYNAAPAAGRVIKIKVR